MKPKDGVSTGCIELLPDYVAIVAYRDLCRNALEIFRVLRRIQVERHRGGGHIDKAQAHAALRCEAFASYPARVMLFRFTADKPGSLTGVVSMTDAHKAAIRFCRRMATGRQISPVKTPELAAAARVSLNARGDASTGWSTERIRGTRTDIDGLGRQ